MRLSAAPLSATPLPALSMRAASRRPAEPPVALQRLSAFVLETLPWALCGMIALGLIAKLVG
jgi:hypothetical protein